MNQQPAILICSPCDDEPEYLIQNILKSDKMLSNKINDDITAYQWNINNKYYTAEVYFYALKSKVMHLEGAENIEAVILFVNRIPKNFIELFDHWVVKTKPYSPAVQLVVCRYSVDEQRSDTVLRWCIEHRFELIELEPKEKDEDDYEVDGITRVVEALQAHQWSNIVLKSNVQNQPCRVEKHKENNDDTIQKPDSPSESEFKYSTSETSEDDIDELSTLFKNLKSMKSEVSSMRGTERLDHAEKVVKAFWNAINGDNDEFDDEGWYQFLRRTSLKFNETVLNALKPYIYKEVTRFSSNISANTAS